MLFSKKKSQEAQERGLAVVVSTVLDEEQTAMLYERIDGIPLIARTLMALERAPVVDEIILVTWESGLERMVSVCRTFAPRRVRKVVCARSQGCTALLAGVHECDPAAEFIAIHDPLCPFVTAAVLEEVLQMARKKGAATVAVPVRDTIKIVRDGVIQSTPDRRSLYTLQSPQVVESSLLKATLEQAVAQGKTTQDLAAVLEDFGVSFGFSEGNDENIRVTDMGALQIAETVLTWRG